MDNVFLGMEQMTVDPKGRVGIPARFMAVLRQICPDQPDTVGVMITPERAIKVMPLTVFNGELKRWDALDDQLDHERMILNLSPGLAEPVVLDKQNRIKLNPMMMKLCGIDRQVVFTGAIKYMQIYDEQAYDRMLEAQLPQLGAAQTQVATQARQARAGQ